MEKFKSFIFEVVFFVAIGAIFVYLFFSENVTLLPHN